MLREQAGEAEPDARVALDEVGLPEPQPLPAGARSRPPASTPCWMAASTGSGGPAGQSYPDLVRLRSGRLADAPDAVLMPGDRRRARAGARGMRRRAGRRRPVRRRHQRRRRRRARAGHVRAAGRARPSPAALGRGRRRLADGQARPRPARAGGRAGAGRARAHPRPLPAVLRVRDDRRVRGDPLGRAGLERLRPLRRAWSPPCAWRRPRASSRRSTSRTRRPGRRCASWRSAPRAPSA